MKSALLRSCRILKIVNRVKTPPFTFRQLSTDPCHASSRIPPVAYDAATYLSETASSDRHAPIANRGFIQLEGLDVVKFLQGLVTNHMPKIERGGDGFYCAFLSPQGRVLYDAFLHPKNLGPDFPHPCYILDVDACAVTGLMDHLSKYKLRSKLKITNASSQYRACQAWGPTIKSIWSGGVKTDTQQTMMPLGGMVLHPRFCDIGGVDHRMENMGLRVLLPVDTARFPVLATQVSEEEYTLRRILYGIPEGMNDFFTGASLPLESNLDYMQGVDFRKGCYLGQELTIRTYHTGVTRKRIVPIQIFSDASKAPPTLTLDTTASLTTPQSQSEITFNSKSVGKFCSGLYNVGLALLRLEHVEQVVSLQNGLFAKAYRPHWWPITPPSSSTGGSG
ncbi:aminomethyltransferase [Synchytrium endobioticum]|uniref:Aminomethyltransferase n=1 Tax=Synchytrium endobioticum TaxID=286115 RepID=A0A507DP12_9FUNG|nr:aminomethyltransferase [Synchytrium endobioticum]TPX52608.1 aminomethyltransferase [Synchytrium endobioticum]